MKKNIHVIALATAALLLGSVPFARAQKGVGDENGVSRQSAKPKVIAMTVVVRKVDSHPCENTTGPAPVGTHFLARGSGKENLNIHLGPAEEVKEIAAQLKRGLEIKADVFRTGKMPANHYVAKTLYIDGQILHLRDKDLRPFWAGDAEGKGNGRGSGFGKGRKRGGVPNRRGRG